tara:strand:- start:325 stop:507 length:183 start_codon:yes stop_codon:yes gene_type:complete
MEQISFVIPFGDTTDPQKVAKKLAKELQFCEWMLTKSKKNDADEGIAVTRFILSGWTERW